MSVYVDDMRASFRGMIMCHMISESEAELHAMADRIGIARRWYQGNHYDISLSKRALAVRSGAIEITWTQAGLMIACVKWGLAMPSPENAKETFSRARYNMTFTDFSSVAPFEEG